MKPVVFETNSVFISPFCLWQIGFAGFSVVSKTCLIRETKDILQIHHTASLWHHLFSSFRMHSWGSEPALNPDSFFCGKSFTLSLHPGPFCGQRNISKDEYWVGGGGGGDVSQQTFSPVLANSSPSLYLIKERNPSNTADAVWATFPWVHPTELWLI